MPQRIQRKRGKGWKMPEGVVYVGWPTKWGNNFRVGIDGTASARIIRKTILGFSYGGIYHNFDGMSTHTYGTAPLRCILPFRVSHPPGPFPQLL